MNAIASTNVDQAKSHRLCVFLWLNSATPFKCLAANVTEIGGVENPGFLKNPGF